MKHIAYEDAASALENANADLRDAFGTIQASEDISEHLDALVHYQYAWPYGKRPPARHHVLGQATAQLTAAAEELQRLLPKGYEPYKAANDILTAVDVLTGLQFPGMYG